MKKQKCDAASCSLGGDASGELDVSLIRKKFPIFANQPELTFFDNAATAQKPQSVLRRIAQFYRRDCANAGRAAYRSSTQAAREIENARKRVAGLINASSSDLVFTSGATESLNTVALSWGLANLKTGDEVMVCFEDHKSCVQPWVNLKSLLARFGVNIEIVPFSIHLEGDYELKSIRERVSPRTRLLTMTHVHHLFGLDMEVAQVREIVGNDVLISLDASQSVGHRRVDVQELGVDFLSFSGHKMFAAGGVGVLWVSSRVQSQLVAIKGGGKSMGLGAIELEAVACDSAGSAGSAGLAGSADLASDSTNRASTSLSELLECGTQAIASIVSLIPAIDLIEALKIDRIERRVSLLSHLLYDQLKILPGIEFSPGFGRCGCPVGFGIIAFRFEHIATSDLAFVLDGENFQVRTGDHCIGSQHKGDNYARVSLHVYNTEDEIARFVEVLKSSLT